MYPRQSDAATAIAGIAGIAAIIIVGCALGYNHTLIKIGIAAIAGLAGFAARGIALRP